MTDHDRFADLWTNYLEGLADEAQVDELRQLLASDEQLLTLAADLYQSHRLLGFVADDDQARHNAFVRETMKRMPKKSDGFIRDVMAKVERVESSPRRREAKTKSRPGNRYAGLIAALALTMLMSLAFSSAFWSKSSPSKLASSVDPQPDPTNGAMDPSNSPKFDVRFAHIARAQFFGELVPRVDSLVTPDRDYVLMGGLVEIEFPTGASAIVEGPAVFRVLGNDGLALDVGRCSVHAPDGAEGFRLETPVTKVVDRGTRFTVNVDDTNETEVQVIEGAADVYERSDKSRSSKVAAKGKSPDQIRLTDGQAKRFAKGPIFAADSVPFNPSIYRKELPDRVISYEATEAADGGAENLLSVTLQRDGRIVEHSIDDLIPVRVIWFRSMLRGGYVCSNKKLPADRLSLSSDHSLVTGVINPGGSVKPLKSDPMPEGKPGKSGIGYLFETPVMNGPGPDMVFFDLQTFVHPTTGDPFHISPLKFREGLRSHTIRTYDLTMESPYALELTRFNVNMFKELALSLRDVEKFKCEPRRNAVRTRALAVAIDFSDLGYDNGDFVEGFFIQDVLDDGNRVDPVFIGGLPPLPRRNDNP